MSEKSVFQIPSYSRQNAFDFDVTRSSLEIFEELNAIAEEIEECRARNI